MRCNFSQNISIFYFIYPTSAQYILTVYVS